MELSFARVVLGCGVSQERLIVLGLLLRGSQFGREMFDAGVRTCRH